MGTSIRATPITRRVMEASQRLRIIAKYTIDVDEVDLDAATELGIMVCHAATEDNCFAVAEATMAMMLAILKKIQRRDAAVRADKWREREHVGTYLGARISDGYPGITVGIVGLGRIGLRVAQLLTPWRVRIIAHDPYVEPVKFLHAGVPSVDYETLLRESDVISYHVTLTKETRYMLAEQQLKLVKPNVIILNTARSKVVDETALARAIDVGRVAAAGIDAFEEQPPNRDSPLFKLGDRVLMSPHATAFNGDGELRSGIDWAARAVHAALTGKVSDNVYNKDVLKLWKERFGGASVTG
jgi:phosphoglycerate dehydrogenase-like enzyme